MIPVAEARFCRVCGAPLSTASVHMDDPPVSPLAQTMPLSREGRPTEGLSADDPLRRVSDTSKVDRKEMESILRRVHADHVEDSDGKKAASEAVETAAPQTTTLASNLIATAQPMESSVALAPASSAVGGHPSPTVRGRRMWQIAAVVLLCVALVAGALAIILSRKAGTTDSGSASPISISDQKQLVSDKLAEADGLLAAGEFDRAIEVLRATVKLDPTSADLHLRLGNALARTGARNEAIDEYRAAAQSDPNNVTAWRVLAAAQFEERLYSDAAESYRRLLVANGSSLDDETWLAYGDALRLAGRTDEARTAYQKISASASANVALSSRQHLAELGPAAVAVNQEPARDTRIAAEREPNPATPSASPKPSVAAVPTPAPANNEPQVDFDSYYFQALNIVNGRDPKKIERADLLRALGLFQRAAQGGTHRLEAQRHVDRLGKEYDRRKKW